MRICLRLAYDGTHFSGWQVQEKPDPPITIQGVVEAALFSLCGKKVRVYGAGRTDAGVHAHAQAAHLDWPPNRAFDAGKLQKALNALLPSAVRIISAQPVSDDFHSRNCAISKTYVYQLWRQTHFVPPYLVPYVWQCGPVDLERMRRAAALLVGQHDFSSFQNAGTPLKSTVRIMHEIKFEEAEPEKFYIDSLPVLRIFFTANGFLKQMARNMAGLLVATGRGKIEPEEIPEILSRCERRLLPAPTAPARGLALAHIDYGKEFCNDKQVK